jgi:penicillin-binding protein 1A
MQRLLWVFLLTALGLPVGVILAVTAGLILTYHDALLDFEQAVDSISTNTILFDAQGQPFHTLHSGERRQVVERRDTGRWMQLGVLAAEDTRFFQHRGIDPLRILSALWVNLRSGEIRQGASTITQQIVKVLLLTPEQTVTRKVREALISIVLELKYSKSEILEAYLNTIYLGHGNYGVEQAAQSYFQKHANELTLGEAALLAGIIRRPEFYLRVPNRLPEKTELFPQASLREALVRRDLVLREMLRQTWITTEQYQKAQATELQMYLPEHFSGRGAYFIQEVVKRLKNEHSIEQVYSGGYRVHTSYDPYLQELAEQAAQSIYERDAPHPAQIALVSLEPHTGFVRAMVGGRNFKESEFNRAVQAIRQPGSAFKPTLYATALENSFSPNQVFVDEPVVVEWIDDLGLTSFYAPGNADGKFGRERVWKNRFGEDYSTDHMTLAKALERSINTVAVQVLNELGLSTLMKQGKEVGLAINGKMGLCVALGCSGTTLLDLAVSYTPFANGGVASPPVLITRIETMDGQVIYEYQPPPEKAVYSPWTAHRMNEMLRRVVLRGTGRNAQWGDASVPIAGKTGTNSDGRDAWFVGYTPELVTGVWIGHDDNTPMPGEQGGRTPARVWRRYSQPALQHVPARSFPEPPPHALLPTCSVSGKRANHTCPDVDYYSYPLEELPDEYCEEHPGFPIDTLDWKADIPVMSVESNVDVLLPGSQTFRSGDSSAVPQGAGPSDPQTQGGAEAALVSSGEAGGVPATGTARPPTAPESTDIIDPFLPADSQFRRRPRPATEVPVFELNPDSPLLPEAQAVSPRFLDLPEQFTRPFSSSRGVLEKR